VVNSGARSGRTEAGAEDERRSAGFDAVFGLGAPFFIGFIWAVFFVVDEVQSLFWQIDWVIFIS
jgi:hypothetical protein